MPVLLTSFCIFIVLCDTKYRVTFTSLHRHYIGYTDNMIKPITNPNTFFTMKTSSQNKSGNIFRTAIIKMVLVVALISTGGAISLAAGGLSTTPVAEKREENNSGFYYKVRKALHCPDFIGDKQEKAEIWLHVNEDGSLVVKHIKTDNSRLAHYIMKGLNGISFELPIDEVNKDYHFALRFQLI